MDDTAIVSDNVEIFQAEAGRASISWSAAIAGAVTATAVNFILIALGSGIGLAIASPYSAGPSVDAMTVAGAIWLVFTQAIAFAAGGFLAGRLRARIGSDDPAEARFRDGATGFMAWAIGAVVVAIGISVAGAMSISAGAQAGVAAVSGVENSRSSDQLGYFVDALMRAPQGRQTGTSDQDRAQVLRILATSVRDGRLSDDDKAYLASLVAARAGISQDEAQSRVASVVDRARESLKQAADKTRAAAAYVAFWTFMSLLFGAVAAALGGLLGGELRDESTGVESAALMPR